MKKEIPIRDEQHEWCGKNIILAKAHHPRKGERGIILCVIHANRTYEEIEMDIRLTCYDPNSPFGSMRVKRIDVWIEMYVVQLTTTKNLIPREYLGLKHE